MSRASLVSLLGLVSYEGYLLREAFPEAPSPVMLGIKSALLDIIAPVLVTGLNRTESSADSC